MGVYNQKQIRDIIIKNPNKNAINWGKEQNNKLRVHIKAEDLQNAFRQDTFFENKDVFASRSKCPTSNKDLFSRILQEESMVFTARGGSSHFNLSEEDEKNMNSILEDIRFGMSLRKWVSNIALYAFRTDPMGVVFIEQDQVMDMEGQKITEPKCYPTYKSIQCIHDYASSGRKLEYICFVLTVGDCMQMGVIDNKLPTDTKQKTAYYRFVDDSADIVYKLDGENLIVAQLQQLNPLPIPSEWGRVPAFVISDIMEFDDNQIFLSPIHQVLELADNFLYDRSVRDLSKKYHAFPKSFEPLMKCSTCSGEGVVKGTACPDCTPANADRGTGYKLQTKPSDVLKFPLDIFEKVPNFNVKGILGYASADIATWDKQDSSLDIAEQIIYSTYWGCSNTTSTSGMSTNGNNKETATKTISNLQPKYSRLNTTADWAEKTENMIAEFIGKYFFNDKFKSNISYGRNYILETPDDIIQQYYDMRTNGVPEFMLDEQIERYLRALYQNSPIQMAKYLKLLDVEPFPHVSLIDAPTIITNPQMLAAKLYFGEWKDTLQDIVIIGTPLETLRQKLYDYAETKMPKKQPVKEPVDNSAEIAALEQKLKEAKKPTEKRAIQAQIDKLQTA